MSSLKSPALRHNLLIGLVLAMGCTIEKGATDNNEIDDGTDDNLDDGTNDDDDGDNTIDSGDDSGSADADDATALRGVIIDINGHPIDDVTVTSSTGDTTETDSTGLWAFEDNELEDAGDIAIDFNKSGYAFNQKPISIVNGNDHSLNVTLAAVDFTGDFDGAEGLSIDMDDGGATVDLPAGTYLDENGEPYTGTIYVESTLFDVTYKAPNGSNAVQEVSERSAAPGDFSALDSDGDEAILESFGMIQVNLYNADGEEVQIPEGQTATIKISMQGGSSVAGDAIPAWSYDEDAYKWIEEGEGVVNDNNGTLEWEFEASHFSSWNTDYPVSTWGCIQCQGADLYTMGVSGLSVSADGVDYNATTSASADTSGDLCVDVKNDATVALTLTYTLSGQTNSDVFDETIQVPGFQALCDDGTNACTDIGDCPLNIPW
mgnify:CR=1 FL=1